MSRNVYHLQPPQATADAREPLEAAVLEASGYIRALNGRNRRAYARVLELKSGDPAVRRSHSRALPIDPQRPLRIFSIEEAEPEPSTRQVRRA